MSGKRSSSSKKPVFNSGSQSDAGQQVIPDKLSLSALENWLFGAANILRGPVDQADYKTYIFPLLFFKRICDVFDEEYQKALEEAGGDIEEALFRENYHFIIPEECHWDDVRDKTENVGQALSNAMRCIETANQDTLYEIFGDAQWTNKQLFSDKLLIDLIEHFSEHNLSNSTVEPDIAGQAYEYLIKKFADLSNKKAGEFYTPRPVIRLMTLILQPNESEMIYDPACGTGGMLLEAFNYVRAHGGEYRRLRLFGQEKNLTTSSIARMNLFLHGIDDFNIVRGDVLANPAFLERDKLKKFDVVLANPPYSIKKWNREAFASDPYGRNMFGVPPQGRADYAFFQHIIASMNPKTGRCAILFPHGVLFREDEQAMREKIISADIIECVLGLGPGLFYNSPMDACVVVCRMQKPNERKGKILFIDASEELTIEKNQSRLEQSHCDKILKAYQEFKTIPEFAKVIKILDIKDRQFSLKINEYIHMINGNDDKQTLDEVINLWIDSNRSIHESLNNLTNCLKEVKYHE